MKVGPLYYQTTHQVTVISCKQEALMATFTHFKVKKQDRQCA